MRACDRRQGPPLPGQVALRREDHRARPDRIPLEHLRRRPVRARRARWSCRRPIIDAGSVLAGAATEPVWDNGLTVRDLRDWEARDRSPLALAAVQWRRVVESIREEAARLPPEHYVEVCYERFVSEPHDFLDELASELELPRSPDAHEFMDRRFNLRDMNFQWGKRFGPDEVVMLNELMADTLKRFGYGIDPPRPPSGEPGLDRPFPAGRSHSALEGA